nr:MAG TPA: hypothetical protein [Inoviridae sp.]
MSFRRKFQKRSLLWDLQVKLKRFCKLQKLRF